MAKKRHFLDLSRLRWWPMGAGLLHHFIRHCMKTSKTVKKDNLFVVVLNPLQGAIHFKGQTCNLLSIDINLWLLFYLGI